MVVVVDVIVDAFVVIVGETFVIFIMFGLRHVHPHSERCDCHC